MYRRLHTAARGLLGYTVLVILWGAYVRVTGSGAGCADHWPLCNGELVPRPDRIETVIELTHRVTSALAGVFAIVLWGWARRVAPAGHGVRRATGWGLFFMLVEGAVGALLVKLALVEDDASVARAVVIGVHLANTFALLAAQALTVHYAAGGGAPRFRGASFGPALLGALVALLCVGASGAITALGDTLFPAASLAEGVAQDMSPTAHFLVRLRVVHPLLALAASAYTAYVAVGVRQLTSRREVQRRADLLVALILLQVAVGFANVWLLAPAVLQIVHLLLADLTWVALVMLTAEATTDPLVERVPQAHPRAA